MTHLITYRIRPENNTIKPIFLFNYSQIFHGTAAPRLPYILVFSIVRLHRTSLEVKIIK